MQPAIRIPICPRCGNELIQPDPGHYVCDSCGWIFPSNEFDGDGVREQPAPADEKYLGTDADALIREWKGLGELNQTGFRDYVFDAQGRIVTPNWMLPPDRQHSLTRLFDGRARKTWEERRVGRFRDDNCDKMEPKELGRRTKLFGEGVQELHRDYRLRVNRLARDLSI